MNSKIESENKFWVRDPLFYRQLFLLALPMVLQNFITFGVIFSDNLMVGRLGDKAISGLYLGSLVQTVLQILIFGVESTVLILSAQYWGKRDFTRIKEVISIGMRITLIFTAVIALISILFPRWVLMMLTPDMGSVKEGSRYLQIVSFSYLFFAISQILIVAMRSIEVVRIGLINSIIAFCVNVLLNYLLIFGKCGLPELGVRGAAYATVISRIVELAVVVFFVVKIESVLRLRFKDFRLWNKLIWKDLVKYGSPLMLGQVVWAINNIWQGFVVGQLQSSAITAVSICGMFDRLLWMGTWGVAAATGVMVGKAIGEGNYAKVRQYAKTMQVIFLGIGLLSGLLIFFGYPVFLSFYKLSPEAYQTTEKFMWVLALIIIGRCYQAPSLFGLVKSGGDTAFVFKNDTFWVFCWIIPLAGVGLYLNFSPWLIYAILLSDQITKCFVALVKINRFNWMKNLTRN